MVLLLLVTFHIPCDFHLNTSDDCWQRNLPIKARRMSHVLNANIQNQCQLLKNANVKKEIGEFSSHGSLSSKWVIRFNEPVPQGPFKLPGWMTKMPKRADEMRVLIPGGSRSVVLVYNSVRFSAIHLPTTVCQQKNCISNHCIVQTGGMQSCWYLIVFTQ